MNQDKKKINEKAKEGRNEKSSSVPVLPPPVNMPPQPMSPAPAYYRPPAPVRKQVAPIVRSIRRACAWMSIVTVVFAVIFTIVAIWAELGGDVGWKAWSTFAIVGFGSLIISLIAQLLDN